MKAQALLILILSVVSLTTVFAQETPSYLRSREAFLADYQWLPKGIYTSYGVVNYRTISKEGWEFIREDQTITASPVEVKESEAHNLLRHMADYYFFGNLAQIKVAPAGMRFKGAVRESEDDSQPTETAKVNKDGSIGEVKEMKGTPMKIQSEYIRLYAVTDAEATLADFEKRGLAARVGETELNDLLVYTIALPADAPSGVMDYFCIAGMDGMLVCASSLETLELSLAARLAMVESMADQKEFSVVAENHNLYLPTYMVKDNAFAKEQYRLQLERDGRTMEDVPDEIKAQYRYEPPYVVNSRLLGSEHTRVKTVFFYHDIAGETDRVNAFVQQVRQMVEMQKARVPAEDFLFEVTDTYLVQARSVTYETMLEQKRAQMERLKAIYEKYEKQQEK